MSWLSVRLLRSSAWTSSKRLITDVGPLCATPSTTIPAVAIEARGETTILHPIEDVFDFLADPRNEPKWLPGARSVTKTSDGPVGAGSKFVGEYQRAGRVELELAEFQRPVRVTFRARSKIVHFDDVVDLAPFENGTRLMARMTAEPQGLMRFLAPVMARTMRRQFSSNWDHLRRAFDG